MTPPAPLPEPLRAAEVPSFTNYSVVSRLPDIARRVIAENDFPPETVERLQALIDEIPGAKIRPLKIPLAPDAAGWSGYVRPYLSMDWLEAPWFFIENYFYLRVLEATGFFAPGTGKELDPYRAQKRLGLESTRGDIRVLAGQVNEALDMPAARRSDALARLFLANLWGNQNDLSLWPVRKSENGQEWSGGSAVDASAGSSDAILRAARQHVLADDTAPLLAYLEGFRPGQLRVEVLVDNAGYELVTDLALADYLLSSGLSAQVTLHGKSHPIFVSDATDYDMHHTLDFLTFMGDKAAQSMAIRLRSCLINRRLRLRFHPFWTSPLPDWEMPADLAADLNSSTLIISKGDAHYRRLLGDRHWPMDMPFAQVVRYFRPAVLALRTLKSEIAVGIEPAKVPSGDPNWMINGRWGLMQFAPPNPF